MDVTACEIIELMTIKSIETIDPEMRDFLFSLGCFEGRTITLISILGSTYIVNISDARYSIDAQLAQAIKV
ncbi:MAG: ferrous iron transport protein A [Erysipelothrix sp.]|nr:ferrous iron transport protein A [Erysipelothrix sp.]